MQGQTDLPCHFGPFFLLKAIAQGGMGSVYLAKHAAGESAGKICVIKKLRTELLSEQKYVNRFIDEAKIVLRLHHENICKVFDVGLVLNEYYLAMEYLPGVNLRTVQNRLQQHRKALPDTMAITLICDVLEALNYAHQLKDATGHNLLGVVHRDVSPQNVIIDFSGYAKLSDFG